MKFDRLHKDTDCNCVDGAEENISNIFSRAINRNTVREIDFTSNWDKPPIPKKSINCNNTCKLKGISISRIKESDDKQKVIENYVSFFKCSPKYKEYLALFKFKKDAGLIKNTPSKNIIFHHDFYKSDEFTMAHLEHIELVHLLDYV